MEISIIIPTYNEESCISTTLDQLTTRVSHSNFVKEIIVVDANSQDRTQEIVKAYSNIKLFVSKKGRPFQMNYGAKVAEGSILYFLHADSIPPRDFDVYIVNSVRANFLAGCFRMQFDSKHLWMQFISWLTKFNYRPCRGGDQSLYVTKSLFEDVGAFDESYLIFEDHEILAKLYRKTNFRVIPHKLVSSSRRFQDKGIVKLQLLFFTIYFKRWMGASPQDLYAYYAKYIR